MTAVTTALETPFARQGDATAQSRILDPTVKVSYDILCFVALREFAFEILNVKIRQYLVRFSEPLLNL